MQYTFCQFRTPLIIPFNYRYHYHYLFLVPRYKTHPEPKEKIRKVTTSNSFRYYYNGIKIESKGILYSTNHPKNNAAPFHTYSLELLRPAMSKCLYICIECNKSMLTDVHEMTESKSEQQNYHLRFTKGVVLSENRIIRM